MYLRKLVAPLLASVMLITSPALPAPAGDDDALAALQAALPGKLMNDPTRMDWVVYGRGQKNRRIKTPGVGGGIALQVSSPHAGANPYDIGVNIPLNAPVIPDQPITVAFWARTVSAETPDGYGRLGLRIQMNEAPYAGFGDKMMSIGPDWQIHEVRARADRAIGQGGAVIGFQIAAARQVVEIGQIYVLDMSGK
ncbi:hypothetical protein [Niveispirillum fermenti]|uniref:hypothetical protein n=1 Tax=Niveispirillum fermenti TaxID=1233113 RepID=UPI003A87AE6F